MSGLYRFGCLLEEESLVGHVFHPVCVCIISLTFISWRTLHGCSCGRAFTPCTFQVSAAASADVSFVMLKPESLQRGQIGRIIAQLESKGYKLVALKMIRPTEALLVCVLTASSLVCVSLTFPCVFQMPAAAGALRPLG